MRVRIEVSGGLEEIQRALAEGGLRTAEKIKAVLSAKADQVISLAGPLVPVDPKNGGQLAATLRKTRPVYLKTGVVSQGIVVGGKPLESFVAATGHHANIYAVLQEYDVGEHAPYHHSRGEAHFIERPVQAVAPSIPDELLAAISPADLGGA